MNIQQQTTSEVSHTEAAMNYNKELDLPPPQDISNVFAAAELSSCSSSDSSKYKPVWIKAKVIRSYILSSRECPYACSRALSIVLNHKEISPIMAVTGIILTKQYANTITQHEQSKRYYPMQHQSVLNKNKQNTEKLFSYPI